MSQQPRLAYFALTVELAILQRDLANGVLQIDQLVVQYVRHGFAFLLALDLDLRCTTTRGYCLNLLRLGMRINRVLLLVRRAFCPQVGSARTTGIRRVCTRTRCEDAVRSRRATSGPLLLPWRLRCCVRQLVKGLEGDPVLV